MTRGLNEIEMGGVDSYHVQACMSQMSSFFISLTTLAKKQQAKLVAPMRNILTLLGATARIGNAAALLVPGDAGNLFSRGLVLPPRDAQTSDATHRRIDGAHGGA